MHPTHIIIRHYALKGGQLTFRTSDAVIAHEALRAIAADNDFTVVVEAGTLREKSRASS